MRHCQWPAMKFDCSTASDSDGGRHMGSTSVAPGLPPLAAVVHREQDVDVETDGSWGTDDDQGVPAVAGVAALGECSWGPDARGVADHVLISDSGESGMSGEELGSGAPVVARTEVRRAVNLGVAAIPTAWLQPSTCAAGDEAALFCDYASKLCARRCGCKLKCMETFVEDQIFLKGAFSAWLHLARSPPEIRDIELRQQFAPGGEGHRLRYTFLGKPLCRQALFAFLV